MQSSSDRGNRERRLEIVRGKKARNFDWMGDFDGFLKRRRRSDRHKSERKGK